MNKIIRDIIDKKCSDKQKKNELDKLSEDIEMALGFYLVSLNIVQNVMTIILQDHT